MQFGRSIDREERKNYHHQLLLDELHYVENQISECSMLMMYVNEFVHDRMATADMVEVLAMNPTLSRDSFCF